MSVALPYFKDASLLPGPLPTQEEIETATEALPTIRDPTYDGRIVVIRNLYVVKYGNFVMENEGHVLLYIERHLSIPAPRLYAMYRKDEKLYIVMDYIPGENLHTLWPSLSTVEKSFILGQLRAILDKMRSLPAPDFFGSVARGPVPYRYFYSRDQNPAVTGPFANEADFSMALAEKSRLNWADTNQPGWTSRFFARNLPVALKGHDCVFTHSDLHPQNIIVQQQQQPADSRSTMKYYIVRAIIDWETAGWYPSYWEYAAAFALLQWTDDWPESLEAVVDPWPLEAAMLKFVHRDLEL
ncbi:predicted protein [Uncinocarpus reesii 1704]|uniref:Aminoglycoside phosphotransferase domain-containing protein n=1 Tax=Uncinocarpus reesii (strain UAMH 1704) TaxID=336963 RepID=C4JSN7_UNCRE|nr:uncharacterized protein UREG_05476 [Uncinocarpus reesii 1704]EEP80634.1 predicted protein [Uncinocarpus reesii 1704]